MAVKKRGTGFSRPGKGGNIIWMSTLTLARVAPEMTLNDKLTTQPLYNNNPPAWRECAHQDHMAEVLIWSWGYSARKGWQHTHPLVHWGVSWGTWALYQREFCYTDLPVNEEVRNIRCASAALLCHHLIKKKKKKKCWWQHYAVVFLIL